MGGLLQSQGKLDEARRFLRGFLTTSDLPVGHENRAAVEAALEQLETPGGDD